MHTAARIFYNRLTALRAKLMGGGIGASSVLGEGSTFSFSLCLPLQSDAPTL